jgi:hypothetical protein
MSEIYVDILGHKAEVTGIKGRLLDGIWYKEDYLDVWLQFAEGEAVGSTLSFGIVLPVKNYGRDELLKAIRDEGERRLKEIKANDE